MTDLDLTVARLRAAVADMARCYPDAWRQFDEFRALQGTRDFPRWPQWCFCPMAAAYAIVSGGGDNQVPIERGSDIALLSGLAAWRVTQGIYQYDPTVAAAVWDTPVKGNIPVEILQRIPEWCVYVTLADQPEIQGRFGDLRGTITYGFFAFLEADANHGHAELRLILDTSGGLVVGLPIDLVGTVEESLSSATEEAARNAAKRGVQFSPTPTWMPEYQRRIVEPCISMLLYLCSENAEMVTPRRHHPHTTRTKGGLRMFPPDNPSIWTVAYRLGNALRRAQQAASEAGKPRAEGMGHASPRAHIRRAHWHSFWEGPRGSREKPADPADRKLVVRWMPPIPVNVDDDDSPIVPTVHRV